MIIECILGQMFFAIFNIVNSRIDAYRIMSNKTIAHSVNFIAYFIFCTAVCILLRINFKFDLIIGFIPVVYGPGLLFLISAFLNRQFSFDIPLNLRRGLSWDYQTKATGPKASVLDRLERFFFGNGEYAGRLILAFYLGCYIGVIASFIIVYG